MPFAELKDNIRIHYNLIGRSLEPEAVKVSYGTSDDEAAMLLACQNEGYQGSYYSPSVSQAKGAQVMNASMRIPGNGSVQARMAAHRPVLTYSYRGSGQSSVPKSLIEYSVNDYREDARQLAAHVGLSRFNLVGYSHGGYFAADYALNYPQQISALVLIEPALFVDRAKLQDRVKLAREGDGEGAIHLLMKQMAPEMAFNSKEYNDLVKAIKKNYPDPIGLAGEWYARSTNELAEKELSQISVPTLVIGGERSWVRENVARTARFIPGARQVWIDGTHNLLEERPEEVTAAVEAFLSERRARPEVG